jgi:hypothetical protein
VGQFRSLPAADLRAIESICAEGMEAMGYGFEAGGRTPSPASVAPRPSRWRWLLDRLRYYGANRRRWQRGAARWKVMVRVRVRWLLGRAGVPGGARS